MAANSAPKNALILAKTESNWLKEYLRGQGRALTIARQLMVVD